MHHTNLAQLDPDELTELYLMVDRVMTIEAITLAGAIYREWQRRWEETNARLQKGLDTGERNRRSLRPPPSP